MGIGIFDTFDIFNQYKKEYTFVMDEKGRFYSMTSSSKLEEEVHEELAELKDILTAEEYNDLFHEQLEYKKQEHYEAIMSAV